MTSKFNYARSSMSSQRLVCSYLLNAAIALTWLLSSLSVLPNGFPWINLPLLLIVIPAGPAVFYASRMIISTLALLFSRASYFHEFYGILLKLGTKPDRIYFPGLRYVVLFVVPVGMISSVPTRIIVEPCNIWLFIGLVTISVGLVWLSNLFWKYALRHYASASS